MKRILSILFAAMLLCAPLCTAQAETAADMRLEATQGAVSVNDEAGSWLSVYASMKLFSGYRLNTAAQSYAWLSLDETKALKLDAVSRAQVRKAGEKLEVELLAGKLLCDVSAPLRGWEKLDIRTSTTITGVRGTVLVVKVIDEFTTVVYVLEGKVTLTEEDPLTGKVRKVSVSAGQLALSTTRFGSDGAAMDGNDVTIRTFTADEVDAFVLDEIARNPAFVEHLRTTTAEEVQKLLKRSDPAGEVGAPVGEAAQESGGPTYVNVVINGASDYDANIPELFMDALRGNSYLRLRVEEVEELKPGQNVTVGSTQTLTLQDSTLNMEGNSLDNAGTINVNAGSTLQSAGTLTNSSSNTLNVYGALIVTGALVNTGTINIYGLARVITFNNMGILNIVQDGTLQIVPSEGSGDVHITPGTLTNTGTVDISGTLGVISDSHVTNQSSITVAQGGTLANEGVITNQSEGLITNEGAIENSATINNSGSITNDASLANNAGAVIYNTGDITNNASITNEGQVTNEGSIANEGSITNSGGGSIIGSGSITGNPVQQG